MKTLIQKSLSVLALFALLFSFAVDARIVQAQTTVSSLSANITFAELGQQDIVMQGPYDSRSLRFSLPLNWALQPGAEITLYIDAAFAGSASAERDAAEYLGGMLDVYFNNRLQKSVALRAGDNVAYTIPIAADALIPDNVDGRLEISFFLNAAIDCEFEFNRTSINLSADSNIFLPYLEQTVQMDLRRMPWPIYQRDVQIPNPALVILSNDASAAEIQAAMLVMAGFSRMSQKNLEMELLPRNQVTEEQLTNANIIFVAKAENLALSTPAQWPLLPGTAGNFASDEMQENDGVLQLAVSPWNEGKSVLLVSGNSDEAIVKAAQAATSGNVQTASNPAVSFVAEVNPLSGKNVLQSSAAQGGNPRAAFDYPLSALGYATQTSAGVGTNWFTYEFIIPPGEVPTNPTYLEVLYSNSAMLDPNRSGFAVYLNNQVVGSVRFDAENNSSVLARVNIPASIFRTGVNKLDIAADLIPNDICSIFTFSGLWMTVFEETYLHLPLRPATGDAREIKDLKNFPTPFNHDIAFATTTLVLSRNAPELWTSAGKIAYELGNQATGTLVAFEVAFDDNLSPQIYQNRDLIYLGTPATLPSLQNFNEAMPASFEAGSNIALLKSQQVVYRVTENKDLGYLQIFGAPGDSKNSILLIGGTSAQGVMLATDALLQGRTRDSLSGNFASIDGNKTIVADTRTGSGIGRAVSGLDATMLSESDSGETAPLPDYEETRQLILQAILGAGALMVVVFGVAAFMGYRRRTSQKM